MKLLLVALLLIGLVQGSVKPAFKEPPRKFVVADRPHRPEKTDLEKFFFKAIKIVSDMTKDLPGLSMVPYPGDPAHINPVDDSDLLEPIPNQHTEPLPVEDPYDDIVNPIEVQSVAHPLEVGMGLHHDEQSPQYQHELFKRSIRQKLVALEEQESNPLEDASMHFVRKYMSAMDSIPGLFYRMFPYSGTKGNPPPASRLRRDLDQHFFDLFKHADGSMDFLQKNIDYLESIGPQGFFLPGDLVGSPVYDEEGVGVLEKSLFPGDDDVAA